jgi:hypothetical protein
MLYENIRALVTTQTSLRIHLRRRIRGSSPPYLTRYGAPEDPEFEAYRNKVNTTQDHTAFARPTTANPNKSNVAFRPTTGTNNL